VNIGSVTPLPTSIFTGGDLFLEIQVGAETLAPRQRLGSVAYAFRAGVASSVASERLGSIAPEGVQNLVTLAVNFPSSGTAIVRGMVSTGVSAAAGTACYGVSINTTSATVGANEVFDCISNAGYREGYPTTEAAFAVVPGAQTFFLVGEEQIQEWTIYKARLTVMFFPDAIGPVNTSAPQEGSEKGSANARRVGNSEQ
jgi:hypothetical protein